MHLHRIFILLLCFVLLSPAYAWWAEGHRTVARLAATQLNPQVRAAVARLLTVEDTPEAVADAMAKASTWADQIRDLHRETSTWHFIDIALQDAKDDMPARCPNGDCIVTRLKQFSAQLSRHGKGEYTIGFWSDADALRFVIHFVGDLHQPLHATDNADLGGNCVTVQAYGAKTLHGLWDGGLLKGIRKKDRELTRLYLPYLQELGKQKQEKLAKGSIEDWTWESHNVAKKQIYRKLDIPLAPPLFPKSCAAAPAAVTAFQPEISPRYFNDMKPVLRNQIIRAALRLARLLNEMFS